MQYLGEITKDHRNKTWPPCPICPCCGQRNMKGKWFAYYELCNAIGRVLKTDIGKRVYRVNGILQVENNEQRDRRLKKNAEKWKDNWLEDE